MPSNATLPLQQRAVAEIREDLIHGRFRPGERLSEPELAGRFQTSRSPIREALVRPSARQMTLAVSKFAQRLDFRVIAEGVDSVVEREVVGALGFGLLEGAAAGGWQFAGGKQPVRIAPLADENPS